jgi:membrane protease YdiL (CAAX protease family)
MEPEAQPAVEKVPPAAPAAVADPARQAARTPQDARELRDFEWAFIGPHGLRAGWSILLFASLYYLFRSVVGTLFFAAGLVSETNSDSAAAVLVGELIPFFALLGAAAVMGLIEDRSILNYNLAGPRRVLHFLFGLAAGFAALSLLVGTLAWGGWLRTGPSALSAAQALRFAALWACAFLIVGSVEEGLFRCYTLSTLTRGINFWWALAAQIAICLYLSLNGGGHGVWGVYAVAALGLFPCLALHQRIAARSAFWQAAWVTSTVFGLYHTSNSGENWIGILAASFIGFVFCVSVRVTGSAWWAIGCHAAWDWAETFFYGAADSGLQGQGHYLTASPAGNPLWSGGADGPEGSLLVLGAILLLLLFLVGLYGRRTAAMLDARQSAD